jgi:hypothetical protein
MKCSMISKYLFFNVNVEKNFFFNSFFLGPLFGILYHAWTLVNWEEVPYSMWHYASNMYYPPTTLSANLFDSNHHSKNTLLSWQKYLFRWHILQSIFHNVVKCPLDFFHEKLIFFFFFYEKFAQIPQNWFKKIMVWTWHLFIIEART